MWRRNGALSSRFGFYDNIVGSFFLWWILFENENQNSEKDLIKIVEDILLKKVMQILMKEAKRNLKRGLAF